MMPKSFFVSSPSFMLQLLLLNLPDAATTQQNGAFLLSQEA